jgi:hypothetical protein
VEVGIDDSDFELMFSNKTKRVVGSFKQFVALPPDLRLVGTGRAFT